MLYDEWLAKVRAHVRPGLFEIEQYGEVRENGRGYPLLCAVVPGGPRQLVITTGFHGEEPAGPLTMSTHLGAIVELVRTGGIGARIYLCINPSGFEAGHRYNASGERPNNDFLRYETAPGVWKGELAPGEAFLRWKLADDGPKETRALRDELERHAAPDAALDIHQDDYLGGVHFYGYAFGDPTPYLPMIEASARHAEVIRSKAVDQDTETDEHGLVVAHDGSVTDYYHRRGVPHTVVLETTTKTRQEASRAIHFEWIRGLIRLAAER